ncbi:MAG: hypothetical protein L0I24_08815 [Pseudonocardia sp.]|nr:hypothetical protein [Pseudonocardia sp.]
MTTEAGHGHGRSCYWDHLRCGWVCGPARDPEPAPEPVAVDQRSLVDR